MAPKRPKLTSSLLCCIKRPGRRKSDSVCEPLARTKPKLKGSNYPPTVAVHEGDEESTVQQRERQQEKTLTLSLPSHAEIEFEDGPEPGYARILKTPSREPPNAAVATPILIPGASKIPVVLNGSSKGGDAKKEKHHQSPEQHSSPAHRALKQDLDGTLDWSGGENMAAIARVPPFKHSNNSNNNHYSGSRLVHNGQNSHYRIEDVTDDPKYKDPGENGGAGNDAGLEGSLIEYCRLDAPSMGRQPPRHSVCEPASVVTVSHSIRPNGPALGNWALRGKSSVSSLGSTGSKIPTTANWRQSPPSATSRSSSEREMAHVIDVETGQPCSAMAQCNCIGFRPHAWRKVCVHCKCDRADHEIGPNKVLSIYERLGIKPTERMAKVMSGQRGGEVVGSVGHGYVWVPPGLGRTKVIKVEEYMSSLPNHIIPRVNSIGEKNRERQLMVQLPRQDLSITYCKHLKTSAERRLYEEFLNARNEVSLDIGYVNANVMKAIECKKCRGIIGRNEMAVIAPKLGDDAGWHPACFACATCDSLLIDLTYCVKDEKIYCERHYAELHKPRCSACDELIFSGEYTKAMNKDWHSEHFCCWQCDSALTGQRYILRDEHPYCIKCYEEIFANQCDECAKSIGIDSKDLSYKDKHWHEDCFLCNMCKISLVDKPFGSKNERIFCSNCYDQAFATRCDGCGEIFRAGMKKMEYKGKQWHDKCFVCESCKTPIGTRSFIPKNDEVYCSTCYEEKFATRCTKCKKVISTGGVTYKNEPWHRECFTCSNCNTSLAGQRFTSKDEKPYCADCYGELFAKRCSACVKPITGIGGAKFISFEDRHWHSDCFICAQCTTSLVGKGFITDGADILCPECAKARLMAANS